jgi:lipopolysaccharide transport system permease protein
MIISAFTTKYRDIKFLSTYGIQLFFYLCPVMYPLTIDKISDVKGLLYYNPLLHLIEGFRFGLFGEGFFDLKWFIYSCGISLTLFIIAFLFFNRVEKDFMDTI